MTVIELVPCEFLDGLECPCGNATHLDGFDTVLPDGTVVEPTAEAGWTSIVRCVTCGRLYDIGTHDEAAQTVAVVKGPDLTCRDCGLGAHIGADGKVRGERDVDPCPSGDDDFHHWIGVVRSTCVNPDHDHDAINDREGYSTPTTNLCNGCRRTCHYDRSQECYFHDRDDEDNDCFLAGPNDVNPCREA